jgi:MYXO-CTERM domain-containing protein
MTFSKSFSALMILGVLMLSAPAWADVAPEDNCSAQDVGKACNNALGDDTLFQQGVCKETMCTRASPQGSMTFACYRCLANEGGAGGQPSEGGSSNGGELTTAGTGPIKPAGGTSAGGTASGGSSSNTAGSKTSAGSASDSKSSDDGGCSVSEARDGAGALGGMLVTLGLAVATLRRRRRNVES